MRDLHAMSTIRQLRTPWEDLLELARRPDLRLQAMSGVPFDRCLGEPDPAHHFGRDSAAEVLLLAVHKRQR